MKYLKFVIIVFIFLFRVDYSYSLIEVDITRGNLNPLPIAVSPLSQDEQSKDNSKKELDLDNLGSEISQVIENNLKKSGLFNPLNKDAFLQKPDIAHLKPRFEDWALIKAQALITGNVSIENNNRSAIFKRTMIKSCFMYLISITIIFNINYSIPIYRCIKR